jgi:Amidase
MALELDVAERAALIELLTRRSSATASHGSPRPRAVKQIFAMRALVLAASAIVCCARVALADPAGGSLSTAQGLSGPSVAARAVRSTVSPIASRTSSRRSGSAPSSGSGAAVAAGLAPATIGGDTGGSIRGLRHCRAQADLRPGQPARRIAELFLARPCRAARLDRGRFGDPAVDCRRVRPRRSGLGRRAGKGLHDRPRCRDCRPHRRRALALAGGGSAVDAGDSILL